jgi:hypothetical protein
MDSNLLSALIGLIGGLLGVAIGAYLQQRVTDAQLNRQTTLQLYERLDDSEIRESRIRADALLATNAALARPLSLSQLYATLPRDEWQHIARTRHFLDQIGLLHRTGYLDNALAGPLFTCFIDYWIDRYFGPLEAMDREAPPTSGPRPHQWRVSSIELKQLFSKSAGPTAIPILEDRERRGSPINPAHPANPA